MITHRISGSRVGLAMLCGYSARTDVPQPPRVQSEAGEKGTSEHALIENTIRTGEETPQSPTHATWLAEWWPRARGEGWRTEVAFAVNPKTGEAIELSGKGHRDYSQCPAGWVPLTLDALLVDRKGGVAYIRDWKTGYEPSWEPAATNPQLLTGALAVAGVYGVSRVEVGIVHVTADRYHEDAADVDVLDLEDWRATLDAVVERVAHAEPSPGPHCRAKWCDHYGRTCPATAQALVEALPEKPRLPVVVDAASIQGPEHASYLYQLARAAKARLDAIWEALRVYSDEHGGIPAGEGLVWKRGETRRETIDLSTRAAVDALKRELGDAWAQAVTVETSKSAIKIAAGTIKAQTGETIAAVEARTLAALREVGAVQTKASATYDERRAKVA